MTHLRVLPLLLFALVLVGTVLFGVVLFAFNVWLVSFVASLFGLRVSADFIALAAAILTAGGVIKISRGAAEERRMHFEEGSYI